MRSSFVEWHRRHHRACCYPKVSLVRDVFSPVPMWKYWEHPQSHAQVSKPMADFQLFMKRIHCKAQVK